MIKRKIKAGTLTWEKLRRKKELSRVVEERKAAIAARERPSDRRNAKQVDRRSTGDEKGRHGQQRWRSQGKEEERQWK
jgi:hypothetical protein